MVLMKQPLQRRFWAAFVLAPAHLKSDWTSRNWIIKTAYLLFDAELGDSAIMNKE